MIGLAPTRITPEVSKTSMASITSHAHYKITRYNLFTVLLLTCIFFMVRRQDISFLHMIVYICCCVYLKKIEMRFFYAEFQIQCLTIKAYFPVWKILELNQLCILIAAHISKIGRSDRTCTYRSFDPVPKTGPLLFTDYTPIINTP